MAKTLTDRYKKVTPTKMEMAKPSREYYPSLSLPLKDIPAAEEWEVGETYEIALKVRQTSISKDDGEEGGRVGFDILAVKTD